MVFSSNQSCTGFSTSGYQKFESSFFETLALEILNLDENPFVLVTKWDVVELCMVVVLDLVKVNVTLRSDVELCINLDGLCFI